MRKLSMLMLTLLTSSMIFANEVVMQDKTAFSISADKAEFTLKVKSNPTTGFSWFLTDYNSALLEPVKHSFEAPTDKKLVGAPGYELWTFRAKPAAFTVPQQTLIRLVYTRPWNNTEPATMETFRVTTVEQK
jgi:inhibitor of cysteine peptidase